MPAPFYNAVKSVATAAAGTGDFTPGASVSGFRAWSTVPTGWMGLVRYEDGSNWSLAWGYWNGTTISRPGAVYASSNAGAEITLTINATAAMVIDASDVMPHLIIPWRGWTPIVGTTGVSNMGFPAPNLQGTAAGVVQASTNYLTEQARVQYTSATTANAQAGFGVTTTSVTAASKSVAGTGGWEYTARFGASQLPTNPRLFAGMTITTITGLTTEPSALVTNLAVLGKDSTDANLQFMLNNGAGAATKINTGIPWVANGWYEVTIWNEPGSLEVHLLLMRLDTGAIFYTKSSTDAPANAAWMRPEIIGGLSATTGTAIVMQIGGVFVRGGG